MARREWDCTAGPGVASHIPPGCHGRDQITTEWSRTMNNTLGHAAFHLREVAHGTSGTRGDRRNLLRESMRHLNPKDIARHAKLNTNIVPAESNLNSAFVNDGAGGFAAATRVEEVLDYGDARVHRVRRKLTTEQRTVTLFVVHLPKSLCVRIPDYYPRKNPDGSSRLDPYTGEPMSRSRWVARDRDEAMRYFHDAVEVLTSRVIPGGHDAIHGWATNFDETTPHIQLMADPFAPDPNAPVSMPDALRTEYSQAYGSHREVRRHDGKQRRRSEKLRDYQYLLRAILADQGWPVDYAVGPRHGKELPKSEFEETKDAEATALAALAAADARAGILDAREAYLDDREAKSVVAAELAQAALTESRAKTESDRQRAAHVLTQAHDEVPHIQARAKADGLAAAEVTINAEVDRRSATVVHEAQATARAAQAVLLHAKLLENEGETYRNRWKKRAEQAERAPDDAEAFLNSTQVINGRAVSIRAVYDNFMKSALETRDAKRQEPRPRITPQVESIHQQYPGLADTQPEQVNEEPER